MAVCFIAHILRQGTGVGKHQPFHYLRMPGRDDLGHHTAQRLAYQPGLFPKPPQQLCYSIVKFAVVGKLDLIIKGQYGKIPCKPFKVPVKQIGKADPACQ